MFHLLRRFTLILFIAVSFQATAQSNLTDAKVDSLLQVLHLPALDSIILITEKAPLSNIWRTIKINRGEIKKATLLKLFQKIEKLAATHQNSGLEMYAGIWQYYTRGSTYVSNYESIKILEKVVEKATNSKILWIETTAKFQYAYKLLYAKEEFKNIEKGIWILRENIEKIHKENDTNISPATLLEHYRVLTSCYYNMEDLPNAIIYSVKALNMDYPKGSKLISPKDKTYRSINNNLGVYYRENQQLDSSTFYFKRVYDLPLTNKSFSSDSLMKAVSGGNLGENLYLQGNYNDALPLLQKDADFTTKVKVWGNASNALILIADIYLRKGDFKKAKEVLDKATYAAHTSKDIKRLSKLYPVLSKFYKTIGQPNIALTYADSTFISLDSLKRKNNQFRGANVEQAYNKHQLKKEAETALQIKNDNIKRRNIGLFILGLLLIITYFSYRKSKQKAKQQENTLLNEVDKVTQELNASKKQLNVFIQEAQQKALSKKVILTDEDWREFLQYYNKVHPRFVMSLKKRYPKLTESEVRFCCLTYLSLSDKEMAAMLGVGRPSIRVTRQRSRAKLKITKEESFETLFQSL
ncbi:tetratricopeptide repeat protein [Polaribacter vadi]|uniref:tetratricopeptide repeat protein n=1 Tax=Polaribacter TaxID=52959 RepID=UPI001C09ADEF|nr:MULTISPECIES: tetratricopeptide repeat protein [Polaribacter]MBU3010178.1 tetratricopeptide repeat protein [Polaribacter vadi]MDO6739985.1 tetratricopeptide repeat protein [Polaribacter sp. 1_MG-2023]